jgi:mannan endo-1,4-beta-mannosidase
MTALLTHRDEPTILAWELMNEPNGLPQALRDEWIAQMSAFVKFVDPNHLVSSGLANVQSRLEALSIPTIDFATWHGYPLYYSLTIPEFNSLITDFCNLGASQNKPVLMEEFAYARSNPGQAAAYSKWLQTLTDDRNCGGWLVWRAGVASGSRLILKRRT